MTEKEAKEIILAKISDTEVAKIVSACMDYRLGMVPKEEEDFDGVIDGKGIYRRYLCCGKCGKTLYLGEKFCPECGMKVNYF